MRDMGQGALNGSELARELHDTVDSPCLGNIAIQFII